MITLVSGGVRSGKSSFAEKIAKYRGNENVIYLATAEVKDKEMEERIRLHKLNRPEAWQTIEEPLEVAGALKGLQTGQVVLLDCITVLISNIVLKYSEEGKSPANREAEVMKELESVIKVARDKKIELIMVTNEVGMGLVPANKLGRMYRDITGRANKYLAKNADQVYVTIMGLPVDIKEIGRETLNKFKSR